MRHIAIIMLRLGIATISARLPAAPPEGFDARVDALRKRVGVPGMAIAIVEDGKVTLAKGYGGRKLGSPAQVDADTIFPTGSTGKAFTVADLGILVDQGRIGWDDKVIDHLPGFQMYDPWVTREMTIRDLLVHRSGLGLGAGDLLFAPRPASLQLTQPMFSAYALGWDVQDYRGTRIVWHGGAVFGFQTAVVLIPDRNVGFSIEINSEDGEVIVGLMDELLDHYLGLPRNDWPEKVIAYKQEKLAGGLGKYQAATAKPAPVGPSLALSGYAGTYVDPWYGNIQIDHSPRGLAIDFKSTPRMRGALEHWQYDTFITHFDDKAIEPAYVTFALDAEGKIERITMKPVSPLADFSYDYQDLRFEPVKAKQ
jgi:CubicO group peptidase (beta-lactamase class C family)